MIEKDNYIQFNKLNEYDDIAHLFTKKPFDFNKFKISPNDIESQYEDLRSKYNLLYKTDPTTILRVPFTATLFGDTVTQLFSNKIEKRQES